LSIASQHHHHHLLQLVFTIELFVQFIMQFFNKAMEGSSDAYFDSLQESYMMQIALSRCMNFDKQEESL
jgi:hypothetical protein